MATVYPNGIDDDITLPLVFDNISEVKADTINRVRDAVRSVELALGINPQGTYTNTGGVSARLNNIDAAITNLNTGLTNVVTQVTALIAALDGEHINLGTPSGGFAAVGITTLQPTTPITEAINTFNNIMAYLAPAQPQSMQGLAIDAVTSVPIYSGNVADVTGHSSGYFKAGLGASSTYSFITKTQVFTLTTHDTGDSTTGFSDADKGILVLHINNAGTVTTGTFDLFHAFDEGYRTTSQGSSYFANTGSNTSPLYTLPTLANNSQLQIYSVGSFNGFPLWQKGVARVTNVTLQPGYNYFYFTHTVGTQTRTSGSFELFYDNGATNPTITGTTITVSTSAFLNYLSGIRYLTIGDSIQLTGTIHNAFVNTYAAMPITYSFTAGISNLTVDLSSSSQEHVGPTGNNAIPNSTDTITILRVFSITIPNQQTIDQLGTVTYSNIYGNTFTGTSSSANMLINTYNTISTNNAEYFVDETYRMLPNINGSTGTVAAYPNDYVGIPPVIPPGPSNPGYWNPQTVLSNGNAQSFNAQLIYPHQNFLSSFLPAQQSSTNYSGFTGGQVYYRAMYSPGNPRSTGTLTIGGITLTDLTQVSPNIKVEMKLPGITGWLDFRLPFDNGTFTGTTGQGCRTTNSGSAFGWSVGTFTTATSGFMYILRITLNNTSRTVTSLVESFT